MAFSNQNGTSGDFAVRGHIVGDGSLITGVTVGHVVGLDGIIASLATTASVDTAIATVWSKVPIKP